MVDFLLGVGVGALTVIAIGAFVLWRFLARPAARPAAR